MRRVAMLAPVLVVVGTGTSAMTARADHVDPVVASGNVKCSDVAPGTKRLEFAPAKSGTRTEGDQTVTVTADGTYLDWTSTVPVDKVIVKGGPDAHVYTYDPESTGDTRLSAPDNGGQPYGLSHVEFCWDDAPSPPPPPDGWGGPPPPEGSGGSGTSGPPAGQGGTPSGQPPEPGPDQEILPEAVLSGRAGIRVRGRCRARTNLAVVAGRQIERVRFVLDGRRRKTVRPQDGRRATYRVPLARVSVGTHRLVARIRFTAVSQTAPRSLRIPIARCSAARRILPRFTG